MDQCWGCVISGQSSSCQPRTVLWRREAAMTVSSQHSQQLGDGCPGQIRASVPGTDFVYHSPPLAPLRSFWLSRSVHSTWCQLLKKSMVVIPEETFKRRISGTCYSFYCHNLKTTVGHHYLPPLLFAFDSSYPWLALLLVWVACQVGWPRHSSLKESEHLVTMPFSECGWSTCYLYTILGVGVPDTLQWITWVPNTFLYVPIIWTQATHLYDDQGQWSLTV